MINYVERVPLLITESKKKLISFKHHCSYRMRGFLIYLSFLVLIALLLHVGSDNVYNIFLALENNLQGAHFFPSRCMAVLQQHSFRSLPKIKGQGYAMNNDRGRKCSKQMMISELMMAPVLLLLNVSTYTEEVHNEKKL